MMNLSTSGNRTSVPLNSAPKVGDIVTLTKNIPSIDSGMLANKGTKICVSHIVTPWSSQMQTSDNSMVQAIVGFIVNTGVEVQIYACHFDSLEVGKNIKDMM